jgi:hypothetical protein
MIVAILALVLLLIVVGAILGKLTWERAIVLLLVTLAVAAFVYFLMGGGSLAL